LLLGEIYFSIPLYAHKKMEFQNKNITNKKELMILIEELKKRFVKFDFLLYDEYPREKTEFIKGKIKKIIFKYKDNVEIVYELTPFEYKLWRGNFPMQKKNDL